ncbi:MAG: Thiol:disulfide interchange protein DsbD [candidate division WS2 bacterium]|nr:Thiol:disulfide interchange protein DsbD [Candidatus Lithacetigena glycinireducens]
MFGETNVTLGIAFFAGVVTFFSPCILPLIPSYLSYITGMTFDELTSSKKGNIRRSFFHSIFFILGFSTIFILLGSGLTFAGQCLRNYSEYLTKVGGILIILFGVFISGIIKFPSLQKERRLNLKSKPAGYLGSALVGVVFGAGWTPCVGPILASILTLAATSNNLGQGVLLLSVYSLGLAVPFILSSLALNTFLTFFKKFSRFIPIINYLAGIFLIIVGLLLFFDKFNLLQKI